MAWANAREWVETYVRENPAASVHDIAREAKAARMGLHLPIIAGIRRKVLRSTVLVFPMKQTAPVPALNPEQVRSVAAMTFSNGSKDGSAEEHPLTKAEIDSAIETLAPTKDERERVSAKVVTVTPEMAEKWLENNPANRNVSETRVDAYAAEMKAGNWRINNQGIAIGQNGELFDGQHRLWAVIRADKPVPMLVVSGLLPGARPTIDKLKPRTLGHELTMFFNIPRGSRVATTLNHIRQLTTRSKGTVLMGVLLTELEKYRVGVSWATLMFTGSRIADKAYVMAPMAYAHKSAPGKVEAFAEQLKSGESIRVGDPAYTLRNYLLERLPIYREPSRMIMMKVLTCTYAAIRGEQLKHLKASAEALKYFAKAHGDVRSLVGAEEG